MACNCEVFENSQSQLVAYLYSTSKTLTVKLTVILYTGIQKN